MLTASPTRNNKPICGATTPTRAFGNKPACPTALWKPRLHAPNVQAGFVLCRNRQIYLRREKILSRQKIRTIPKLFFGHSIDSVWLLLAQFLRKVRKRSSEFLRKVRKPYHKLFPFQQLLRIVRTKNQGAVRGVREYFVILQTLCFFRLLYII